MLSAYWLRYEIRSKSSTTCQGLRGTPFIVVPDLLAACLHVSCWWFLSKATGGPLCRELDWWYVPLLLVQLEPQLDLLLHGVKLVPPGMTFTIPIQISWSKDIQKSYS